MSGDYYLFKRATAVMLMAVMLTGCSKAETENLELLIEQDQPETVDPALDMSYEVPVDTPEILIDQCGYEADSEKVAVFRGTDIDGTFEVRNLETDEVVYVGEVRRSKYNKELEEYDSCGYFTELTTEGDYYIYNRTLGSSYAFSIKEKIYSDMFDEAGKIFYLNRCGYTIMEQYAGENAHAACHVGNAYLEGDKTTQIDVTGGWHLDEKANRDVVDGCNIAQNLLLAYELNKDVFSDDTDIPESNDGIADILNEVKVEVDWLLKMQDEKTGGVYASALTQQSGITDLSNADVEVTPITMEATISFAALLAKFSYLYQSIDSSFATDCLRAADRAWKCYSKNENAGNDGRYFQAAAELYRATGSSTYNSVLDTFFSQDGFIEGFVNEDATFLGGITYLSTKQDVSKTVCNEMMSVLLSSAEEIANKANNSTFFVTSCLGEDLLDKMFDDLRCLTVTNYIIYNHEYTTIIENHIHFLMGVNPDAINYVTDSTENSYALYEEANSIMSNPVYISKFMIMLSVVQ